MEQSFLYPKIGGQKIITLPKTPILMKPINILVFILCLTMGTLAHSQTNPKEPAVSLNGSLRLSAQFYRLKGETLTQTPFIWAISGTPVVSVKGIRFPVNFTYRDSKLESNLSFPLNRFAASPSWKWGRLHLGQRSMQFTPYTLSGRDFTGVGLELTPGKLRFAAMYGGFRDLNTQSDSIRDLPLILPTFRRRGMALKLGVGNPRNYLDVMVVKIKDRPEKIQFESESFQAPQVTPEDNLVGGVDLHTTLFKRITLKAHVAGSIHTGNQQQTALFTQMDSTVNFAWLKPLEKLITPNIGTRWGKAVDASADIRLGLGNFGVQYKQVDPYFQSLGTFFIRNDFETFTGYFRGNAFKKKVRFNLRGGIERNDLADFRTLSRRRIIGSGQLTFMPMPRLVFSANVSNFQMDNQAGIVELNDTLRIVQVTRLQSLSVVYKSSGKDFNWTLSGMGNYQQVLDQSPLATQDTDFRLINASLNLTLAWKGLGTRITPNINYRYTQSPVQQERLGFGMRVRQRLWKDHLHLQASGNFQHIPATGEKSRQALNMGIGLRAKYGKHHRFSVRARHLNRDLGNSSIMSSTRSEISYTFNF
jgi:hypothetical protein